MTTLTQDPATKFVAIDDAQVGDRVDPNEVFPNISNADEEDGVAIRAGLGGLEGIGAMLEMMSLNEAIVDLDIKPEAVQHLIVDVEDGDKVGPRRFVITAPEGTEDGGTYNLSESTITRVR